MKFTTIEIIDKSEDYEIATTYISKGKEQILEIIAPSYTWKEMGARTNWNVNVNKVKLIECYNHTIHQMENYGFDWDIFGGAHINGKAQERMIPPEVLRKTFNPLETLRLDEEGLGISSEYGSFWFIENPIRKRVESIRILSSYDISDIVSDLLLKTNKITKRDYGEMKDVLEETYDIYLQELEESYQF